MDYSPVCRYAKFIVSAFLAVSLYNKPNIARLACLIHAASVHSEPGSNPPKVFLKEQRRIKKASPADAFFLAQNYLLRFFRF